MPKRETPLVHFGAAPVDHLGCIHLFVAEMGLLEKLDGFLPLRGERLVLLKSPRETP